MIDEIEITFSLVDRPGQWLISRRWLRWYLMVYLYVYRCIGFARRGSLSTMEANLVT